MSEQHDIKLSNIWKTFMATWKQQIKVAAGIILFFIVMAVVIPAKYESTVLMQVKQNSQQGFSLQSAALALLGANQTPAKAYSEIIQSRSVLEPVIEALNLSEDEKKEWTAEKFFKKYMKIVEIKGTDMLVLYVRADSPENAYDIAKKTSESLERKLSKMGQSDNTYLRTFFKDRLDISNKELTSAEVKLLAYSKDNKIFSPDDQMQAILSAVADSDKQKAQTIIQMQANDAKLQEIGRQLKNFNIAITTNQITDHPTIEQLRLQIINKQVDLINQRQKYTEDHPFIIRLHKEIDALNEQLKTELVKAVKGQTATLNPVQAELVKQKAIAEADLLSYKATIEGISRTQNELDQYTKNLSFNALEYIRLKRQFNVAQEVYLALRKQYEQARVQEAMDSMDIQFIDEANIPKEKAFPKVEYFTAAGIVLALIVIAFKVIRQAARIEIHG